MRLQEKLRTRGTAAAREGPAPAAARPAGRFTLHVLEMCAVMCIGGGLLIALFFGAAALLGFSDLAEQSPELSALVAAGILGGVMVAWMRFRGMDWQPTLEMSGAGVAAGALMVVAYWFGGVASSDLVPSVCGVACLAMVADMFFRFRLYSSHTGHRAHAG